MPQQSPISFPMGTKNVLIIDGNEAMQQLRARVLRSRGVLCTRPKASRKQSCFGCLIFSIWYCWTCARDPKKQWSSGERFGASIQGSGSVSWLDPQRTCLQPAPTKSSPATRFLKTGCRGQESRLSHKALQTDSSQMETINQGEKVHEIGALDQKRRSCRDS